MIDYDPGHCALGFICRLHGSVIPLAAYWALPSALAAYATSFLLQNTDSDFDIKDVGNVSTLWSSFQFTLGFLVVFRTQQAYVRYMEGASLLRQTRSEWINAVSCLIAFSNPAKEMRSRVETTQHLLVRLMSLLTCCTLQSMADSEVDLLPVVGMSGFDADALSFLQNKVVKSQRSEIVMQWLQRLVVQEAETEVLKVDSPILARFFQEISKGYVCASQARNLTDIPFPFPYAQMLTCMLLVNTILTPLIAGLLMRSGGWAASFTFITVLGSWATNYTAVQIESPFGDDANDLPLVNIQQDMNASLWLLLEKQTQEVPAFLFDQSTHRKWSFEMVGDAFIEPHRGSSNSLITALPSLPKRRMSSNDSSDSGGIPITPKSTRLSVFSSNRPLECLARGTAESVGGHWWGRANSTLTLSSGPHSVDTSTAVTMSHHLSHRSHFSLKRNPSRKWSKDNLAARKNPPMADLAKSGDSDSEDGGDSSRMNSKQSGTMSQTGHGESMQGMDSLGSGRSDASAASFVQARLPRGSPADERSQGGLASVSFNAGGHYSRSGGLSASADVAQVAASMHSADFCLDRADSQEEGSSMCSTPPAGSEVLPTLLEDDEKLGPKKLGAWTPPVSEDGSGCPIDAPTDPFGVSIDLSPGRC